jgi:hypothetical protein
MGIKITNEAPVGLKAGLRASYQWVNQVGPRGEWRRDCLACLLEARLPRERALVSSSPNLALPPMSEIAPSWPPLRTPPSPTSQDMLDAVGRQEWRQLLFVSCFLHSVVQARAATAAAAYPRRCQERPPRLPRRRARPTVPC